MSTIIADEAVHGLMGLAPGIADMCVTSPPYYGLRDYGTGTWIGGDITCDHIIGEIRAGLGISDSPASIRDGGHKAKSIDKLRAQNICPKCGAVREDKQIGLEETPEAYIQRLVDVFREVRRVLRDDGTLWVNIGDTYAGYGMRGGGDPTIDKRNIGGREYPPKTMPDGCKPKDLIGIPWMLAFALRADGWYLRDPIIWEKPNTMPESVKDRCTKSYENIFMLAKSRRYYYDYEAIREPAVGFNNELPAGSAGTLGAQNSRKRKGNAKSFRGGGAYVNNRSFDNSMQVERETHGNQENITGYRNRRNVWTVATCGYSDAHFATFPPNLIRPCILAGSRLGGIVLDPFFGSGTTGLVAMEEGRGYIGIDLNPEYVEMARRRIGTQAVDRRMMNCHT